MAYGLRVILVMRGVSKLRTGWRQMADGKMRMIKCGEQNSKDNIINSFFGITYREFADQNIFYASYEKQNEIKKKKQTRKDFDQRTVIIKNTSFTT